MSRIRTLAPRMIGRQAQLQTLEEHLSQVRAGLCQVVLVAGEAGAGKTCLVHSFLERARVVDGVEILQGYCYEEQPPVAYGPFTSALRLLRLVYGNWWVGEEAVGIPRDVQERALDAVLVKYLQPSASLAETTTMAEQVLALAYHDGDNNADTGLDRPWMQRAMLGHIATYMAERGPARSLLAHILRKRGLPFEP